MKNILLLFLFTFSVVQAQGPKEVVRYPKGVYFSYTDLMAKKPNKEFKLVVAKRTTAGMKRYGGNEYIITAANFDVPEKKIKKDFYAYSTGDELFINGLKHKLQPWYFKVLSDGKFLVFKSGIPTNASKTSRQMQIANALAPEGKRLSGPVLATLRFLYIMDKETQQITVVDKRSMPSILEPNAVLAAKFEAETDKTNPDILIKYLLEFNKVE